MLIPIYLLRELGRVRNWAYSSCIQPLHAISAFGCPALHTSCTRAHSRTQTSALSAIRSIHAMRGCRVWKHLGEDGASPQSLENAVGDVQQMLQQRLWRARQGMRAWSLWLLQGRRCENRICLVPATQGGSCPPGAGSDSGAGAALPRATRSVRESQLCG